MSQFEVDIIRTLSARSARPTADFAESLRHQLLARERELTTNNMPRRQPMNYKVLIVGLASLVIVTGGAVILLNKKDKPEDTTQTAQSQTTPPPNNSTSQASSLPSQSASDLEEAKKSLSFEPLTPSKQLNNETISDIKTGTKNNMIDDSDTLYVTYADSQGALYKLSASSKTFNDPTEDVESVQLTVNGKQVTGTYYQLPEEAGGGTSIGGALSPTSYLFWKQDGIRYEISEFGRVSKQQLIELASSLQ